MNAAAVSIETRALELAGEVLQTVDARELHDFLQVRRDFSNWIRARIAAYGFVEGCDFVCSPILASEEGRGGSNRKDYAISLDMAKELAMVERTERGKQARRYFIDCERRAKSAVREPGLSVEQVLSDPTQLRQLLLGSVERQIELESTVAAQEHQVAAFARLADADGHMSITRAAKSLQMPPMKLFQWMAERAWIYRPRTSGKGWTAYQQRIQQGLLIHKLTTLPRPDGSERVVEQVLVTPRGLTRVAELLEYERQLPPPAMQGRAALPQQPNDHH